MNREIKLEAGSIEDLFKSKNPESLINKVREVTDKIIDFLEGEDVYFFNNKEKKRGAAAAVYFALSSNSDSEFRQRSRAYLRRLSFEHLNPPKKISTKDSAEALYITTRAIYL